jgi:hypothetical protein
MLRLPRPRRVYAEEPLRLTLAMVVTWGEGLGGWLERKGERKMDPDERAPRREGHFDKVRSCLRNCLNYDTLADTNYRKYKKRGNTEYHTHPKLP